MMRVIRDRFRRRRRALRCRRK